MESSFLKSAQQVTQYSLFIKLLSPECLFRQQFFTNLVTGSLVNYWYILCLWWCINDKTVESGRAVQLWLTFDIQHLVIDPYSVLMASIDVTTHWFKVLYIHVFALALNWNCLFMAALCNRAGHYIFALWFLFSFFLSSCFSSPNLSGRRLDVYHTSTHGVALV